MINKCLAIIPARGGSKRIPKKNIKYFEGKPIIAYSIEVALQSGLFDEVMVSTDDDEIAEIAKKYGATIPFMRSSQTSTDNATTMEVIDEVLKQYKEEKNAAFEFTCCIYATAPLIQIINLKEGLNKLANNRLTCVLPVVAYSYPIWHGLSIYEDGQVKVLWPENIDKRSQDLEKAYHDAGQWYWFNTTLINNWTWPDNTGTVVLSEEFVQDIDTITDWSMAELKYKLLPKINAG
ncbi:MAG: pseudaminic acid cytidylyltransferase [Bacteroidota bacterium]|jgi:pseudaminic acid cytidylyltransferase